MILKRSENSTFFYQDPTPYGSLLHYKHQEGAFCNCNNNRSNVDKAGIKEQNKGKKKEGTRNTLPARQRCSWS
jgi:hypothetical protein